MNEARELEAARLAIRMLSEAALKVTEERDRLHVELDLRVGSETGLLEERIHYREAIEACRAQVADLRAQHEQQFREVRAALGVPDAVLLIDGARSIRAAYDKLLHDPERARDLLARAEAESLRVIIGDAKERLAKLTGAVFVHGPSLAQHIEKVEALLRPTPAPKCIRVSCSKCGDSHDCYDRRASVVVEEDDGDPA